MDTLGPSISELIQFCDGTLSLKSTIKIGMQMLRRLQDLHERNLVHSDIKPQNFTVGLKNKTNMVHLIDFGIS